MPQSALAFVVDIERAASTLARAAHATAYNIHSDIVLRDTEFFVVKLLRCAHNYSLSPQRLIAGRKEGSFAMNLALDQSAANRMAIENYKLFCRAFARAAAAGPKALQAYLEEKDRQTTHALEAFRYKAKSVVSVNDEVIRELNGAIDRSQRIKTACEVAMVVLGAFVPLMWVTNTAVGVVYTIACEVVDSLARADEIGLVAFKDGASNTLSEQNIKSNTAGAAGNIAQDIAGNAATRAQYLLAECQARNMQLVEQQTTRVWDYVANRGVGEALTRRQAASVADGAYEIARSQRGLATADGQAARANAGLAAARLGSIAVGLFFMRESLKKAWMGQTAWEEEQRRKATGQRAQ